MKQNAAEALAKLKRGNEAYLKAGFNPGNVSPEIRLSTSTEGQEPYAVVIACSDSRVLPEAVFSCGIGEIFTVRTAGNTVGETELGSIEYAVEHLHVPLVVVLAHTSCGAVTAAVQGERGGYVGAITADIGKAAGEEKDITKASVANALYQAEKIRSAFTDKYGLEVKAALYHIHSGAVDWLIG